MQRNVEIDGVRLALSQPHALESPWIGQGEILKQLLACWMVVGQKDLPLTPRLVGTPGIGKTALGMAAAQALSRELYIYQCTAEQRALARAFHRARRAERKAEPDWDGDE